ncbi:MAG: hypothetical protein KatS3mg028_0782 [Bacteroidia bacterium]|nr:MAG: hypothetical protein KatS3mg028_0782 [Bacteroidia bacterium]
MLEKETTEILLKFLARKVKEAEEEIEKEGKLSDDKAIPLLLKSQFNHIAHLDTEISSIKVLMNEKFKEVDKKFDRLMTIITVGIAFLSLLIALLYFK